MLNQTEHKLFTDLFWNVNLVFEICLENKKKTFNPLNNSSLLPILRTTVLYFTTD